MGKSTQSLKKEVSYTGSSRPTLMLSLGPSLSSWNRKYTRAKRKETHRLKVIRLHERSKRTRLIFSFSFAQRGKNCGRKIRHNTVSMLVFNDAHVNKCFLSLFFIILYVIDSYLTETHTNYLPRILLKRPFFFSGTATGPRGTKNTWHLTFSFCSRSLIAHGWRSS